LKSVSLNLLELSGSVQACNGIALPFYIKDDLWKIIQISSTFRLYQIEIRVLKNIEMKIYSTGVDPQTLGLWFPTLGNSNEADAQDIVVVGTVKPLPKYSCLSNR
jgi:hypothetical protein